MALHAFFSGNNHHFAWFDFTDEIGANDIQRTGFRRKGPAIADLAQDERTHTHRIAHTHQLGAGHRNNRKRAFDLAQRLFHAVGDGAPHRTGHQVNDAFRIRAGLENCTAFDQLFAQNVCIGQVAVVGNRRTAHRKFAKEWLNVANSGLAFLACRGIAHVANADAAGQGFDGVGAGKVIADIAHAAGRIEPVFGVMDDDAACLLAAVLQRMKTEGNKVGCVSDADNAENAALLL